MKTTIRGGLAVALVLSLTSIWACSAADPSTPGGAKEQDSKASDAKANKSSSSSSSSSSGSTAPPAQSTDPTDPAPAAGQCTAAQGEDACVSCCESKNQKGSDFEEQLDEAWMACACAPAACATQCAATACGDGDAEPADGDACSTCLEQHANCDTAWDNGCKANADCTALQACQDPCFPEEGGDDEQDFQARTPEQRSARIGGGGSALAKAKARGAATKHHRAILQRHHAAVKTTR